MPKHKYIETPEKLWELFQAYKIEVKSNPRRRHVFVGKDGNSEYEYLETPLTMEGFECYCYENEIVHDLGDYFKNKDQRYTEYAPICSRIRNYIRRDQIEGGMVGQYNASITQRLNNLVEKSETNVKVEQEIFKALDLDNVHTDNGTGEDSQA